ncbi:MAG: septum formation initiator family protein [Patescibacteria group bacterium]
MIKQEFISALKKNWTLWFFLGLVFIFSGYIAGREFWRWFKLSSDYNAIAKNTQETEQQTQGLKRELDNLNNPQILEKEARSRLNLKKEGEQVLVVVSEDDFPQEDFLTSPSQAIENKNGLWFNVLEWKRYFFP